MPELTMDQITAAQSNDLEATSAVISATESRVAKLADKAARRMAPTGPRYADYVEEFTQVGRIAVWEALTRFAGSTVDSFFAFIYTTVESTLTDAVREERFGAAGADTDAVKVFGAMLDMADGDIYLAEKFAQTVPPKGKRLSADRASAARLAWQGVGSMEGVLPSGAESAKGLTREAPGQGNGFPCTLAETMPSTLGVPEDLIEAEDLNREASRVKHAIVNGILDVMGGNQRVVIKHSFGIGGFTYYGHGDSGDDAGMSAETGIPVLKIRDARTKGLKAFAKRYIKAVASADPEYAEELTEAATANLSRGGRK